MKTFLTQKGENFLTQKGFQEAREIENHDRTVSISVSLFLFSEKNFSLGCRVHQEYHNRFIWSE